jgi:hypothetical protein
MVATDGRGTVTVAWLRFVGDLSREQLVTSRRRSAGSWERPTVLDDLAVDPEYEDAGDDPLQEPHLSVGPDGSAVIGWTAYPVTRPGGADRESQARVTRRPPHGRWEQPMSFPGGFLGDIAIDDQSSATAVVSTDTAARIVRFTNGRWRNVQTFRGGFLALDLATGAGGSAAVLLRSPDGDGIFESHLQETRWTRPERISPPTQNPTGTMYDPMLVVAAGTTTAVITSWEGRVYALSRPADGTYGPTVRLLPRGPRSRVPDELYALGLTANDAGQVLATWSPGGNDSGSRLQAAYLGKDNHWTAPIDLSTPATRVLDASGFPAMTAVVYPNGDALAIWSNAEELLSRTLGHLP